jgi:hypothetical protein
MVSESAITSKVGGMKMASGSNRGYLCWWSLIFNQKMKMKSIPESKR